MTTPTTAPQPPPTLTYEQRSEYACKVCQNVPDESGVIEHGRGCYVVSEDGGGISTVDFDPPPPATTTTGLLLSERLWALVDTAERLVLESRLSGKMDVKRETRLVTLKEVTDMVSDQERRLLALVADLRREGRKAETPETVTLARFCYGVADRIEAELRGDGEARE